MKRSKNYIGQGFTVIEILIVVAIIAILIIMSVVIFRGMQERALKASVQADLSQVQKEVMLHKIATGKYPTAIDCTSPSSTEVCAKTAEGTSLNYESDNSANPPTYSLTATNGSVAYQITSSTSMVQVPANQVAMPTSGLVASFDALNPSSYKGSGQPWSDISGNAKHAALSGTVSYDGGYSSFTTGMFTTSNSYVAPAIPTGSSPRTIIAAIKTPSVLTGYKHIIHYGSQATSQSYGLALADNLLTNHTWNGNSNCSNITLSTSTKYMVAVTYDNADVPRNTFYVNNNKCITAFGQGKTVDYAINTTTGYGLNIGSRTGTLVETFTDGVVYAVAVYNRKLSQPEVEQAYGALKAQYGL